MTVAQELSPLIKFAWSLTPSQVEEVYAALREVPRERLGSGVAAHLARTEKVLSKRVEIGVFETVDGSGPQLIAQLPSRSVVSEAFYRRAVAHEYLLALQRLRGRG